MLNVFFNIYILYVLMYNGMSHSGMYSNMSMGSGTYGSCSMRGSCGSSYSPSSASMYASPSQHGSSNIYSLDSMLNHSTSVTKVEFETTPEVFTHDSYLKNINPAYFGITRQNKEKHMSRFLNHIRPKTLDVNSLGDIQDHIRTAFEKTVGFMMPDDIHIEILSRNELKEIHEKLDGRWDEGIAGFSLNGNGTKPSRIFIKKDYLDKVMIVIGHELGHVMSPTLINKHDEEAKAFAFEFAWAKAIHENNIANLSFNINPNPPAINGLHNIAHFFVSKLVKGGEVAIEVYKKLVAGSISILDSLSLEQIIGGE
jgi:hypothetical protein